MYKNQLSLLGLAAPIILRFNRGRVLLSFKSVDLVGAPCKKVNLDVNKTVVGFLHHLVNGSF